MCYLAYCPVGTRLPNCGVTYEKGKEKVKKPTAARKHIFI